MKQLIYIFLLILPIQLFAQRWSAGLSIGGSNYQGDLVATQIIAKETNLAYGAFARYNINSKFSIKANVTKGLLSGSDLNFPDRVSRGYSFRTDILQASMNVEWDLLGKKRFDNKGIFTRSFTPYIYTGIGAVMFKPTVYTTNNSDSPYNGEQYGTFNFAIPFGGGIKYDVNRDFTIGLEFTTHIPFSDYMDGVSLNNKVNNDWFVFGGVSVAKWFGLPARPKYEN